MTFRPTLICDSILPYGLLDAYDSIKDNQYFKRSPKSLSNHDIWKELCFCMLSANVNYELAASVIRVLEGLKCTDCDWMCDDPRSQRRIYDILNGPNFEPKRKDGRLRKYRYPKIRSIQMVKAAKIVRNPPLKKTLQKFTSDFAARDFLVKNIPGLGMKESSHFLRNIGYSRSLAIVDVHVVRFVMRGQFMPEYRSPMTAAQYIKFENVMRNLANYHKLDLNIFDMAVWGYMRGEHR